MINILINVSVFLSTESALTGELKISRMSTVVGNAAGNDDLFMFVEKVGKSMNKVNVNAFNNCYVLTSNYSKLENIKVRFFEQDDDQVIWEDWGKFTEADVHHQYAIALKTPPYRKTNIEESVCLNNELDIFNLIPHI